MILALIPARAGSKGVPGKNVRPLAGKPLLAWSVEAALASRRVDRCVVSTDSPEIGRIAEAAGAEYLERPPELATDEADTLGVLQHALEVIDADVLVLLQPTSPIRDPDLVDRCLDQFLEEDADSLATGFICTYKEYGTHQLRRQDIRGFFYDDGNVYINRADLVRRGDRYGERMLRLEIDREQNVDIDTEFDFWLAEQILTQRR